MTRMVDVAENRLRRALERADKFEVEKYSSKVSISRKTSGGNNTSIMIIIPSDLIEDRDEYHLKSWRAERLKDGSIVFHPR